MVAVMKKIIKPLLYITLILTISLLSCLSEVRANNGNNFANVYNPNDTWVVYWYICGSDLESQYGAATSDIEELIEAKLPANVKVVIQTGGANDWLNNTMDENTIGRYMYDEYGFHELQLVQDADMGSKETLTEFIRFGNDNFPADHRVFVFWNHGGGSAVGVCYDERTGSVLSLNDIQEAFSSVYQASPENPPFEMIGFDACLMANYDTANMLHGLARYMTASEEEEPGNGWNYTGWIDALGKNPAMGGDRLGKIICDSYMAGCAEYETAEAATMSVVDLAQVPILRSAYEAYGMEALNYAHSNPQEFFSYFGRSAWQAENYGGNTREQGYSNMVDLGDLARRTNNILPETSANLVSSINAAVVYKVQGDYRQMGSGLSSYYPYDGNIESFAGYAAQNAAPLPQKCLYYYLLYGELPMEAEALLNGDVTGNEGVNIPVEKPSQRLYDIAMLEDLPVDVDSEGYAFVTLSEGQMNQLSSIHFQLMYMNAEDDIILHLGSDSNIIADWETGIFKDNFNGMWPMLDGHPVYVEITAEEDGYNLYSVPIKLNGVECNLMVAYIFADNSYKILGARKGIDEYGMGDRNLIKLKEGDTITTIHYAMTMSGAEEEFSPVEVDNFQIGSQPVFADENMGDGEYGYCFEFVSPTVDSALSQMVQFTVKDNEIVTTVE